MCLGDLPQSIKSFQIVTHKQVQEYSSTQTILILYLESHLLNWDMHITFQVSILSFPSLCVPLLESIILCFLKQAVHLRHNTLLVFLILM